MLRNIIMLCPALAFALPFVAANPTMARPLATPDQPSLWGNIGDDDDDGGDEDLMIEVCFETQILVETDDRAYTCGLQAGPQCLASCSVAGDQAETCRSQCESGGAAFCAPELKARGGFDKDDLDDLDDDDKDDLIEALLDDDDRDDDDDDGGGGDELVFVNIETCLELDLEN